MNQNDTDNLTFLSDEDRIFSAEGQVFQAEKYLPKLNRVRSHLKEGARTALDVGIGYGSFMLFTEKELGLSPCGLDPFPKSIEIARSHTPYEITMGRIEDRDWQFAAGTFDFISCLDVTEHLEEPDLFYRHAKRYLAPGGIVLMTTPLRLFPYEMRSWPFLGIPDKNTTHINVQPPKYWEGLAKKNGYEILDSWYGEHLTHVRFLPRILRKICGALGLDMRTTPLVRSFQQAYNQVLRVKI